MRLSDCESSRFFWSSHEIHLSERKIEFTFDLSGFCMGSRSLPSQILVEFNQILIRRIAKPDIFRSQHHLRCLERIVAEPMLPEDSVVFVAKRFISINSIEIRFRTA